MKYLTIVLLSIAFALPVSANDRSERVEQEVEQIIADLDKLEGVDLDETLISYLREQYYDVLKEQITRLYEQFDADNDGLLRGEEFTNFITTLGAAVTLILDRNANDTLEWEDFRILAEDTFNDIVDIYCKRLIKSVKNPVWLRFQPFKRWRVKKCLERLVPEEPEQECSPILGCL